MAAKTGPVAGHDPEAGNDHVNEALPDASLAACPNCDLLQRLPAVAPGETASCPRCETELHRRPQDALNRTLALAVAAAVLCLIANLVPMLGLTVAGHQSFTTISGGAVKLWANGEKIVALLVLFAAVFAPALQIGFLLIVLAGVHCRCPPFWLGRLLRHHPFTRTWSMLEVMLLGVLVALTKIAEFATVVPGLALFAVGGLVLVTTAMQRSFDPQEVWKRIEWMHPAARAPHQANFVKETAL
jgi:paraquat-inducible protein A